MSGSLRNLGLALTMALPQAAHATLFMEPVFDRVDALAPGQVAVGLFAPDFLNPLTGEPFAVSDRPGRISTYPAGFPADQINVDTFRFVNNTAFDITGFTLAIVGTAVEPEPFAFLVDRDPEVDAFFGDVDGDGAIGRSDIFATIDVSDDGRTIRFSDGLIPAGGLFTDFNFAITTDGAPFLAATDAQFDGVPAPVPLPATWALLAAPLAGFAGWCRRRRRAA